MLNFKNDLEDHITAIGGNNHDYFWYLVQLFV